MDYIREYKSIINSHYLSQGIRMTVGIIMPALALGWFNDLSVGIIVSLGAMAVSITDNPGPIHHRRNGMIACNLVIFAVVVVTGLASRFPYLLGLFIFACCFIFSMIGVYGSRATSIGVSALLVMVLNIDRPLAAGEALQTALYVLAGGTWYMLLSLILYSFRPYRLTQQVLGDCIQSTAEYLRIKASFYDKTIDYDSGYRQLLEQQIRLHQDQDLISELLFKGRNMVKESTPTSRILVLMFLDLVDLFERIMTSQQDYKALHHFFDTDGILEQYRQVMILMADELDEIGIAVKRNRPSEETVLLRNRIAQLNENFFAFRDTHRNAENVEGFIGLRHILESIEDIADRLHTLHGYTSYDRKISNDFQPQSDYTEFTTHQDMDPGIVLENLNLASNIFRHALRVAIATVSGFIISKFLPVGHSYWVLLTIIVILKPAYSLTKKRNYERLFGTIAGAIIGILVIYFFKDRSVLLAFLIFFMICTYSLIRVRYLISIVFMTPYILLLFHLLNPASFRTVLSDRLIDTCIGSGIAFLANIFILPAWEHVQILDFMKKSLADNTRYFTDIASAFAGKRDSVVNYKLSRKHSFVSLANLSDAFNRMLSEPKRKQKNIRHIHQFVVLNHTLTSHIATLAYYASSNIRKQPPEDYKPFIQAIIARLSRALSVLNGDVPLPTASADRESLRQMNDRVGRLTEKRKRELKEGVMNSDTRSELTALKPVADQFNFILKIASDLEKIGLGLQPAHANEKS